MYKRQGLGHDVVVFHLRGRQIQLIGGLNVSNFAEQVHQLREIEKLGEAGARPVAGAFRCQFQGCDGFSETAGPAVKVGHTQFLQAVILEIPLHGVKSVSYTHLDVYKRQVYSKTDMPLDEIIQQYNDEIGTMKSYFTSEYEKTISDNTLNNLGEITDKESINTAKSNLSALSETITSETDTVCTEEEALTYTDSINALIISYENRITAIEEQEKKEAEEKAKKEAEEKARQEEAARQAAQEAQQASSSGNYNSSGSSSGGTSSGSSSGGSSSSTSSGGSTSWYEDENGRVEYQDNPDGSWTAQDDQGNSWSSDDLKEWLD